MPSFKFEPPDPNKLYGQLKGQRNAYGFAFAFICATMFGIYAYGQKGINRNIFDKDA